MQRSHSAREGRRGHPVGQRGGRASSAPSPLTSEGRPPTQAHSSHPTEPALPTTRTPSRCFGTWLSRAPGLPTNTRAKRWEFSHHLTPPSTLCEPECPHPTPAAHPMMAQQQQGRSQLRHAASSSPRGWQRACGHRREASHERSFSSAALEKRTAAF